jgi:cytochrome c biogenesis factor
MTDETKQPEVESGSAPVVVDITGTKRAHLLAKKAGAAEAIAGERQRIADIHELFDLAIVPRTDYYAGLRARAVDEGWPLDGARSILMQAMSGEVEPAADWTTVTDTNAVRVATHQGQLPPVVLPDRGQRKSLGGAIQQGADERDKFRDGMAHGLLVRSGVLVSVHAFASDPTRGLFILGFLLAVIGSSLLLFAFKGSQVKSHGKHELWSRETLLLCNNIMLVAGLLTVLLGTLLPLVHKELGLGSISIGTPFFNHIYSWLIIPFALLLGVGPLFRWRRQELGELKSKVVVALVMSLAAALLLPLLFAETFKPWAAVGIGLGAWIIVTSVQETWARATHKHSFAVGVRKLGNSHWAMILGHVGLAVSIIGIACTQNYSIEKDLRMQAGDRVHFADYEFVFAGIKEKNGPNYDGFKGVLEVHRNGKQVALLKPEKRMYKVSRMPMTEAAIDAGITRDLYAALGEQLDNGAWAVRIYYKPFVRWIWLGGVFMAIGGVLAMLDKRYRFGRREEEAKA